MKTSDIIMSEMEVITSPVHSRRGWIIAWFGLPLAFNIYIVAPLAIYDISDIGLVLFFVMIGTPIAGTGLLLSIIDKSIVYGSKGLSKIILEIIILIALLGNAFVFATIGTIG